MWKNEISLWRSWFDANGVKLFAKGFLKNISFNKSCSFLRKNYGKMKYHCGEVDLTQMGWNYLLKVFWKILVSIKVVRLLDH